MKIYTNAGELAFEFMTFPDGQPHFKLLTTTREFNEVWIELALRDVTDVFDVIMVNEVLRNNGYSIQHLQVRYLLGARMDRAISNYEPPTMALIARLINACGFASVKVLDIHSPAARHMIRNSVNVLPVDVLGTVIATLGPVELVPPDNGAISRVSDLAYELDYKMPVVFGQKKRDMATGKLSGFGVTNPTEIKGKVALIGDDICDGGGTFVGLAEELRRAGASEVNLFVTHGIFSKGTDLKHINRIFCTDSIRPDANPIGRVTVIPFRF